MKINFSLLLLLITLIVSCERPGDTAQTQVPNPLVGTWQLISGTTIENGDTTTTDYTKHLRMIKIINATHFAFLNHDLKKGKDSTAAFVAGGGRYTLEGNQYTEYLEYCSARDWEGNTFHFTLTFQYDTLIQHGIEKIEDAGVERLNIEKYKRVKDI